MMKITLACLILACIYCYSVDGSNCEDRYSRCHQYRDKCTLPKNNPWFEWVRRECRKTCNLCSNDKRCVDLYSSCNYHRDKCSLPKSSKWFQWVSKECRKTCDLCSNGRGCVDIYWGCQHYRSKCSLPKNHPWFKWVSKQCRKTCNLCPRAIEVPNNLRSQLTRNIFLRFRSSSNNDIGFDGCGIPSVQMSRVFRGNIAVKGAWPWIARLYRVKSRTSYCGGSLITPTWVVTAAHCVKEESVRDTQVQLGRHKLYEHDQQIQKIPVRRIIIHPDHYKGGRFNNDIALIELARPAILNERVKTICLPQHNKPVPVGTECFVAGWGKYQKHGGSSKELRQTKLNIITNKYCNSITLRSMGTPVLDTMLCATQGKNTVEYACDGDSGGPLMCKQNGRFFLHGDVSWGHPVCGSHDGISVFGRMTTFRKWIDQYVRR